MLPGLFEFAWSPVLYLVLLFLLYKGIWQFFANKRKSIKSKSLVPIGAVGLILGFVAYFDAMRASFDAIAKAGDISPALVAASISSNQSLPILGLVCLAVSYFFKYVNEVR